RKRLVKSVVVHRGAIGPEAPRRMRIDRQQLELTRLARLATPDLRPGQEEALLAGQPCDHRRRVAAERPAVCLERDLQSRQVRDVLAQRQAAVHPVARDRLVTVELLDQFGAQRIEGGPVLLGPPAAQQAVAIEFAALVIEAVADLVPDYGADGRL